jgi:hypothetical protein
MLMFLIRDFRGPPQTHSMALGEKGSRLVAAVVAAAGYHSVLGTISCIGHLLHAVGISLRRQPLPAWWLTHRGANATFLILLMSNP